MNIAKRALRAFSVRHLTSKFPRETPSIVKKLAIEPGAVTLQDVARFAEQFNFEEVWIFHGIALKQKGSAVILSGPSGIGKSSLLRKITRMKAAEPMDDGFIVAGKVKHDYYVLESGLYHTVKPVAVASRWLRVLFRYRCPYLHNGHRGDMVRDMKKGETLHNIAVVIGSLIAKDRSSEAVTSTPVRLAKLLLVEHPGDCHLPRRTGKETMESVPVRDTAKMFEDYAMSEVIRSHEPGLWKVMLDKILTEPGNEHRHPAAGCGIREEKA